MFNLFSFIVAFVCFAFFSLVSLSPAVEAVTPEIKHNFESCFNIKCGPYQGSGSVFVRKNCDLVWTAAHVVEHARHVEWKLNPNNGEKVLNISYDDIEVIHADYQDGRKVGYHVHFAEVLRYSGMEEGGDDLAVLRLRKKNDGHKGVKFENDKFVPKIGQDVYHIGSTLGIFNFNNFSKGVVSGVGRMFSNSLEEGDTKDMKVYDGVTVVAGPGSSGGGVFDASSHKYVGMLTVGIRGGDNMSYIVPVRRMHEFSVRTKCEWALNDGIEMPNDSELLKNRNDGTISQK